MIEKCIRVYTMWPVQSNISNATFESISFINYKLWVVYCNGSYITFERTNQTNGTLY